MFNPSGFVSVFPKMPQTSDMADGGERRMSKCLDSEKSVLALRVSLIVVALIVLSARVGESRAVAFADSLVIPADSSVQDSSDSLTGKSLAPRGYVGWTTKPIADRKRQSPGAALLKSALVPGLGQLGNRKYLKAALVIGGETYLFLRWLDFRNQTVDARAAFEPVEDLTLRRQLFSKFDTVRDKRNLYAWLTGTLIFASMIDAFVDAHLAKFPAPEKKLSLKFTPSPTQTAPLAGFGARIVWRF